MTNSAATNSKSRLVCPKTARFFDPKSLVKFLHFFYGDLLPD